MVRPSATTEPEAEGRVMNRGACSSGGRVQVEEVVQVQKVQVLQVEEVQMEEVQVEVVQMEVVYEVQVVHMKEV